MLRHYPLDEKQVDQVIENEWQAMQFFYNDFLRDEEEGELPPDPAMGWIGFSALLNQKLGEAQRQFVENFPELFRLRRAIDVSGYTFAQLFPPIDADAEELSRAILGSQLWLQFLTLSDSLYDLNLNMYFYARKQLYMEGLQNPTSMRFRADEPPEVAEGELAAAHRDILQEADLEENEDAEVIEWDEWPVLSGDLVLDPLSSYWRSFIRIIPGPEEAERLPWYVVYPRMRTEDLALKLIQIRGMVQWGLLDGPLPPA